MGLVGRGANGAGGEIADRLPPPEPVDHRRLEIRRQEAEEFEGLIRAVLQGDETALGTLFDRCSGRVFGLLALVLKSGDAATEVTEEVFVDVWQQANRYDTRLGSVFAWIIALAHERAIARLWASSAKRGHDEELDPDTVSQGIDAVWGAVGQRFDSSRVRVGLRAMTYEQRQALLLAYFNAYDRQQIAAQLDIPLESVERQMYDGLDNLRRALGVSDD